MGLKNIERGKVKVKYRIFFTFYLLFLLYFIEVFQDPQGVLKFL